MDDTKKRRGLHPVWFFALLSAITIVISFILSLINLQGTEYSVSQSGTVTTTILTVKSLLTLRGLNYKTTKDFELNNGQRNFVVKDIEVYEIETIDV